MDFNTNTALANGLLELFQRLEQTLIVEKRTLDQIPEAGQNLNLTFAGGRGVVDVVQAKEVER